MKRIDAVKLSNHELCETLYNFGVKSVVGSGSLELLVKMLNIENSKIDKAKIFIRLNDLIYSKAIEYYFDIDDITNRNAFEQDKIITKKFAEYIVELAKQVSLIDANRNLGKEEYSHALFIKISSYIDAEKYLQEEADPNSYTMFFD